MARLIDANALMEEINTQRRASMGSYPRRYYVVGDVLNSIRNAPTVDAVEVVRGQWIPVTERMPKRGGEHLCRCVVNDFDDMPFYMVLRYYHVDKNPHFQHEQKGGMKVNHWMPLPEPPKVDV